MPKKSLAGIDRAAWRTVCRDAGGGAIAFFREQAGNPCRITTSCWHHFPQGGLDYSRRPLVTVSDWSADFEICANRVFSDDSEIDIFRELCDEGPYSMRTRCCANFIREKIGARLLELGLWPLGVYFSYLQRS